jgi:hypothetical protein
VTVHLIQTAAGRKERRNLVSLFMVTALLGLALQETISPVREAVRIDGITLQSGTLFLVFFLTLFRFFIGNILHLQSTDLTDEHSGFRWVFDLFIILAECVVMIFMAGVATLTGNAESRYGFFDLLLWLYLIDVGWVLLMGLLHLVGRLRRDHPLGRALTRRYVPYRWAALNGALAVYLLLSGFLIEDHAFSNIQLTVLALANVLAFVLDVLVFDYDDLV